jgi:hypothetical protein
MSEYEIRLYRSDWTLAIVMKVAAIGMADAKAQARQMLSGEIASAEIWSGREVVTSIDLEPPYGAVAVSV